MFCIHCAERGGRLRPLERTIVSEAAERSGTRKATCKRVCAEKENWNNLMTGWGSTGIIFVSFIACEGI